MKILTISQTVTEYRRLDPNSAINSAMLNRLINEKKITYGSRGNRTVIEWYTLISCLNELLGFKGETFLPKLRTIRKAAEELKRSENDIGVAEGHIRRCVSDGKIGFITIGNRFYVAMQSFSSPYAESLIYGEIEERIKREIIKNDIMTQLDAKLSSSFAAPVVQRKKRRSGRD